MEWMVVSYVICIQSVPFLSEADRDRREEKKEAKARAGLSSVAKMAIDPNS